MTSNELVKSRCDSPWDAQTVSPAASCRGSQRLCGGTWCQLSSLQHPLQPWPDPYTTLRRLFHARNRTDSAHGVRKRFPSDYSFGGTQGAQTAQFASSSAGRRLLPAQSGTILGPGGGNPARRRQATSCRTWQRGNRNRPSRQAAPAKFYSPQRTDSSDQPYGVCVCCGFTFGSPGVRVPSPSIFRPSPLRPDAMVPVVGHGDPVFSSEVGKNTG